MEYCKSSIKICLLPFCIKEKGRKNHKKIQDEGNTTLFEEHSYGEA